MKPTKYCTVCALGFIQAACPDKKKHDTRAASEAPQSLSIMLAIDDYNICNIESICVLEEQ